MKMREQLVRSIVRWNEERDNKDYDSAKEFAMLHEELMEYAHSYIRTVNDYIGFDIHECTEEQYDEVKKVVAEYIETSKFGEDWKVNQLDALADIFFVVVGSIYKLLGDEQLVINSIWSVIEANERKGKERDENGKITKPKDFVGPEEELRKIIKGVVDVEG